MNGALDLVGTWPVPDPAAAVMDAGEGKVVAVRGNTARPGRWASVTKLVTALATLVAVEEGTVGLDDPAGPPGSTVRHLLAHASGLAFEDRSVQAAPGAARVYSNAGYEVLAGVVAERAEMPFERYLTEAVIEPLGLSRTRLEGSPAHGLVGPLEDLLRFAQELVAPTLVSHRTLALATSVAFPGLAGVLPGFGRHQRNDWGLGFEVRGDKDPHWTGRRNSPATFGHFGASGSFLWIDPEVGLACAALSGREFGAWAREAWPVLADAVVEEYGRAS